MGKTEFSSDSSGLSKRQRGIALLTLIISGETIFFLPFVIPRVFRPTYLAVFDITNLELGTLISVYGVVAIFAYLFGGPLADRFSPHNLMATALACTGVGGLYLATMPDLSQMFWIYGAWGMTTIFLFWASLMRTTRFIGGGESQGLAFGLLDGGRGLVAALVGSAAVMVLSYFIPEDASQVSVSDRSDAFQKVILFFCSFVFLTSIFVWWVLKKAISGAQLSSNRISWRKIGEVISNPVVWLQAMIIICAYSGYRVADDISLMAKDILGYDEVQAAGIGTLSLWLRPVAAIGAGFFGDRSRPSTMILVSFGLMLIGGILLAFGPLGHWAEVVVFTSIVSTCLGVFAMRGLYFAIMGEGKIPIQVTGTAVGIASIIGYLPDVYMGPLMGILLDDHPGVMGHRYVFMLLIAFSVVGLISALFFRRVTKMQARAMEN